MYDNNILAVSQHDSIDTRSFGHLACSVFSARRRASGACSYAISTLPQCDRITEKKTSLPRPRISFACSYPRSNRPRQEAVQTTRAPARNLAGDTERVLRASTKHFCAIAVRQSLKGRIFRASEGIIKVP
jgi:hypothetical protein